MPRQESMLTMPTGIHVGFYGRHFAALDLTILPIALKVNPKHYRCQQRKLKIIPATHKHYLSLRPIDNLSQDNLQTECIFPHAHHVLLLR